MTQLNLAELQIGKEESAFGTETSSFQPFPGLISKGDVTPTIKEAEIPIQDMGSRNEASISLHGESGYAIKIKSRLQNGRPFQWLMGGYVLDSGIQIDTSSNNIDFTVTVNTIVRTTGSWIDDGLTNGDTITIAGSVSNDGTYTIVALTALQIDTTEAIVTEAMTSGTLEVEPPFLHAASNSNTIPSYSIEHVINADYSHKFLGCKLNELTLTMTKGQPVICETSFLAQSHSINDTPGNPTQLTTVPYEFHQSTIFTVNTVEYKTTIRQMVITMGNGIEGDWGLASRDPNTITEGLRKCMVTLEIYEADEVLLELLKNRSDFAISVTITRADGDFYVITISNAKLFEPTYDFGGNAVVDILPIRVIGDWTIDTTDDETDYDV